MDKYEKAALKAINEARKARGMKPRKTIAKGKRGNSRCCAITASCLTPSELKKQIASTKLTNLWVTTNAIGRIGISRIGVVGKVVGKNYTVKSFGNTEYRIDDPVREFVRRFDDGLYPQYVKNY